MCCAESSGGTSEKCCVHSGNGDVHYHAGVACDCGGGFSRHFIFPAVLMLLSEEPAHGYSLTRKLAEMGLVNEKAGLAPVYRVLTRLEEEDLAVHEHVSEGQGPARKVFRLTGAGKEALGSWSARLARMRELIDWFDAGYSGSVKRKAGD